jgi:hypothetical protein
MTPEERLQRVVATGWHPEWIAAVWGVSQATLGQWIAGTSTPRAGFLRWLWRLSNIISASLPANHPPHLKPPRIRLRDMPRAALEPHPPMPRRINGTTTRRALTP